VQGAACAPEVARAIAGFNALEPEGAIPRPDLIIVARGGGSMEDLWGFNEEVVARAVAASEIPLISAVGHETDTTLIDYVSDLRAPTPTAAAEAAVPVRRELLARVSELEARLKQAQYQFVSARGQRLADLARALPRPAGLTAMARQRFDAWEGRLAAALRSVAATKRQSMSRVSGVLRPALLARLIERKQARLQQNLTRLSPAPLLARTGRLTERLQGVQMRLDTKMSQRLADAGARLAGFERLRETLGYKATLRRGYAVVRGDGAVLTSAEAARKAREIEIEFSDDRLTLGTSTSQPKSKPKPQKSDPDQGSLL